MERQPAKPKERCDLINDVKRASAILSGSADLARGNDDQPVTKEQYLRIQKAQDALNLAVTSLKLRLSPLLEGQPYDLPADQPMLFDDVVENDA